jgi:prepilin-type N-terminal cleavage/methylation domain-containing protein
MKRRKNRIGRAFTLIELLIVVAIITILAPGGIGNADVLNPYSTAADWATPARMADINEKEVCLTFEGQSHNATPEQVGRMRQYLDCLSYDPTNGSVSEGDIYRLSES